ncbi:MAG: class I SAM-dependent methyltransferase, partial [Gaiellaceae bacterium]
SQGELTSPVTEARSAETGTLPADGVRRMFDRIAPVYDAMNLVMTAGLDRRWRRITVDETVRTGDRVLDACCVS